LGTTNRKILVLLCRGPHTVADLAGELGVTDNAVRAQLHRFQRDGLVRQGGRRAGVRKPHVEYELSEEARDFFPTAYEPVLRTLVDLLSERLPQQTTQQLLLETARQIIAAHVGQLRGTSPRQRLREMMRLLNGSAAGISVAHEGGITTLRSCSCPLASITANHPEVCELLAGILSDHLKGEVRQRCKRGSAPRCTFEIS
jgi:predicted ArsR family transcriptional regulator